MAYSRILQRWLFPALDRLNGTRIGAILAQLAESESLSRERLVELQRDKLGRLLSTVEAESPFYRELWAGAPEERRAESHYPELDGLPVITKEDLRGSLEAFPLPSYRGRVLEVQTSGSTGVPMTFLRSAEQESWFWAVRFRMWGWAGYRMGDPYLAINLNPRHGWKKKLQDFFFRCCYLSYNADNQDSRHIVDCLRSRRIVHVNGFSSSLLVLAEYMRRRGIETPGVRVVTATGDNLFAPQRSAIEEAFGVGVTDYYGAGGEGMHLASQCEKRDRYHVHMENSVVEILRQGRPARPGEVGSVVVTQLDNYAMPLVRYDLGDLATAADDRPCPCGREHQTIAAVNGRACDIVFTPDGSALLPQFFFIGAFKGLERVRRYQVVQDELERITIRLVAEAGCDRAACERSLGQAVEEASAGSLEVGFEWVPDIPLAGAGKPRPVISNLDQRSFAAASVPPVLQG